jgi:hypothetical protein
VYGTGKIKIKIREKKENPAARLDPALRGAVTSE